MKVNIGVFAHNARGWERVQSGDFSRPAAEPDWKFVVAGLALGDLAEPLGFDGIWAPEHQSTRLFAEAVLPVVHKLDAKLHPSCLPAARSA